MPSSMRAVCTAPASTICRKLEYITCKLCSSAAAGPDWLLEQLTVVQRQAQSWQVLQVCAWEGALACMPLKATQKATLKAAVSMPYLLWRLPEGLKHPAHQRQHQQGHCDGCHTWPAARSAP